MSFNIHRSQFCVQLYFSLFHSNFAKLHGSPCHTVNSILIIGFHDSVRIFRITETTVPYIDKHTSHRLQGIVHLKINWFPYNFTVKSILDRSATFIFCAPEWGCVHFCRFMALIKVCTTFIFTGLAYKNRSQVTCATRVQKNRFFSSLSF